MAVDGHAHDIGAGGAESRFALGAGVRVAGDDGRRRSAALAEEARLRRQSQAAVHDDRPRILATHESHGQSRIIC